MHFSQKHKLVLLGLIAGVVAAALGIGGGVIIVPCLVLFLSYEIKKAVGISLAAIVPSTLVAVFSHYLIESSNVRIPSALVVAAGAIGGAMLGVIIANRIRGKVLAVILGMVLLLAAVKMALETEVPGGEAGQTPVPFFVILGLGGGMCSALLGIGGGVLFVPGLSWFGFPMHQAIATSLAIILPTTLVGAIFHGKCRRLELSPVLFLILGKCLGSVAGAVVGNLLEGGVLKIVFGAFLIFSSIKLFRWKEVRAR